jgi:hypothetical protein
MIDGASVPITTEEIADCAARACQIAMSEVGRKGVFADGNCLEA